MKGWFAVACGAMLLVGMLASSADAQRYRPGYQIDNGPYVFSRTTTSKKPRRGYSGFYPGYPHLFCDYERHPVRSCDRRGRCKVTRWVMKEYCD